jgi:hypothetical protein
MLTLQYLPHSSSTFGTRHPKTPASPQAAPRCQSFLHCLSEGEGEGEGEGEKEGEKEGAGVMGVPTGWVPRHPQPAESKALAAASKALAAVKALAAGAAGPAEAAPGLA